MIKPVYLVAFSGLRPAASPGRSNSELITAANAWQASQLSTSGD